MRETTTPGLRIKTRQAVTQALADTALELFDTTGFDQVTVADIVAAAGISQRSFFRYFSNKEDVVFGDSIPSADEVRDELLRHLDKAPVWNALRAAFQTAALQMDSDREHWKRATRVICRTPGLRARYLEKHLAWTDVLVPEIASRLDPDGPDAELRAQTMINTALGCFDVALMRWSDSSADLSLPALIDDVFGFVEFRHA
ncbi:TetR family transcriptional regulator [Streptomyces sp. NPDC056527]|uniref:TetR family transcriptional regulator n=1 Tax=Streptomyces sp. NPDC056527 TaxID=3345853 RepID=UPI0036BB5035